MRAVAQKYEIICLDCGNRWELYDSVGQVSRHTAFKSEEPNYLDALLEKWGFEPADLEVEDFYEIVPDWAALGYASEGAMLEDRGDRTREFLLASLERSKAELAAMSGGGPDIDS